MLAAAWLTALVAVLVGATSAVATTFTYSNGFGATGIASPLVAPGYEAIDPIDHYIYVASYRNGATSTTRTAPGRMKPSSGPMTWTMP